MSDREQEKRIVEPSRPEQRAAAKPDEHRKQVRREAHRRKRIEDLIRQAKAVITGV